MMKILQKLFRYLLTGTFFLLPFIITIGAVAWFGLFIAKYLGPNTFVGKMLSNIGLIYFQTNYPLLSYLIGLLIVLIIIMLIGFIIERRGIKKIVEFINNTIKKIPAIGTIYSSIQQLVGIFRKDEEDNNVKNMTPVFCRFGSTTVLALLPVSDQFIVNDKVYYSVIIPTAPVPFGGAVLMVPIEDVIHVDMTIDQFLSYYGSMGVTGNQYIKTIQNINKTLTENPKTDEK